MRKFWWKWDWSKLIFCVNYTWFLTVWQSLEKWRNETSDPFKQYNLFCNNVIMIQFLRKTYPTSEIVLLFIEDTTEYNYNHPFCHSTIYKLKDHPFRTFFSIVFKNNSLVEFMSILFITGNCLSKIIWKVFETFFYMNRNISTFHLRFVIVFPPFFVGFVVG